MEKDSHGTWSVTIGPLEPNIYAYSFLVDGAKVLDAPNPFGRLGGQSAASLLEIPGDPPRFDETQQVPHGSVVLISYVSTAYKKSRSLYVYLPPGYETEAPRKYPLLYLRHGDGQSEASWLFQGHAGVILENLLAQGKAVPMIIVTTYGESNATGGGTPEGIEALYSELREDVMPLVEQRFRVMSGPENRAIAGLSMGGGQAFTIGHETPRRVRMDWVIWFRIAGRPRLPSRGVPSNRCCGRAKRQSEATTAVFELWYGRSAHGWPT